jgi:nickel superoxide dismutase
MKRSVIVAVAFSLVLGGWKLAFSHCEIPCGIYGDKTRIDLILEDITTIEKSMKQIQELSRDPRANMNQLVRWIVNKEEHAKKIQETVSQYFLHQRVKPKEPGDGMAYNRYIRQLTTLHRVLIEAMKCKQTTDLSHVQALRKLVRQFSGAYFSKDDLEHLRKDHEELHE